MLIAEMLRRFRPVYAADDTGGGAQPSAAAAEVAAIVNAAETQAAEAGEPEYELPEDVVTEGDGAAEPEFEDYDLDGVKVKVPKTDLQKIQEAAYRQADYTRKRQAEAEIVKSAEARAAAAEAKLAEDESFREGVMVLKQIDKRISEAEKYFNSPEYKQLCTDDPLTAQNQFNAFGMEERNRTKLANALGQIQHERNSKAAEESAKQAEATSRLREQALQKVAREIPGWNADRQAKVRDAAIARGYAPEAIDSITDPLHWQDLFYADIGRQAWAKAHRQGSGAARIQAVSGPTRTVGSGAAPGGNPISKLDKAAPDDYVAMRQAQRAGKK